MVVIYDQDIFIIYAPRVINYSPRYIRTGITIDNCHLQSSYLYSTVACTIKLLGS
jgi:hypothetical protein